MYCLGCNYDLSGLGAGPCPECGRAFDPDDDSTISSVPRRERGTRWCEIFIIVLASNPLVASIPAHVALIAARLSLGRWPHRWSRDDPTEIAGIAWLYYPAMLALPAMPVSVFLSMFFLYRLAMGRAWGRVVRAVLLASMLWFVGIWFLRWDPAQVWLWMMD